jgi:hypothetical protein
VATLPLTIAIAGAVAVLVHWWPRLPAAWRRRVSLLTSSAGIAFLVAALRTEGERESALTSLVLVAPRTLVETTSAHASLYYYVLTAVAFLLGFAGLALGDALARWLRPRPLLSSVAVAWLVTAVRFLLEKSAAPPALVGAMGVSWLAPFAGAYLATAGPVGRAALVRRLLAYAFLVRGVVAILGLAATGAGLGTHYDVSGITEVEPALTGRTVTFEPASARQMLWLTVLPQLAVWPAFTVVSGLLGAAVAVRLFPPAPARAPAVETAAPSGPR